MWFDPKALGRRTSALPAPPPKVAQVAEAADPPTVADSGPSPKVAEVARVADPPSVNSERREALRLLSTLAAVERWSPSDLDDGHDAIARNPGDAAELFAEMLARHHQDQDDRVRCMDCLHYRAGICRQHQRAGLHSNVVGADLAALHQRCPAFEHGPGLHAARVVERTIAAPADHLRAGWAAFEKSSRWFASYLAELAAEGWSEAELMALPTTRGGLDAGMVWTLAGFDLERLEISAAVVVAVAKDGGRMSYRRPHG